MVRVNVHKGDLTAVFGVNIHRMSYFFKDRDYEVTMYGRRRPVFHVVRSHIRHTKYGDVAVRLHFAGAKHFHWAGYDVDITVPGLDHNLLAEFHGGVSDEYWMDPNDENKKWITEGKFGKVIADHIAGRDKHKTYEERWKMATGEDKH